jgi:hypothetical protein
MGWRDRPDPLAPLTDPQNIPFAGLAGTMQAHGALGITNETPFFSMIHGAAVMGLTDGPTEVHKVTVARRLNRDDKPSDDL